MKTIKNKDIFNIDLSSGFPEYKSKLVINSNLTVMFMEPMPNVWFRFWTKFILGWEWKNTEKK